MNKLILSIAFFIVLISLVSCASGQKPTKEDIIKVMKSNWESATSHPRTTVDVTEIKIGTSAKANYAQELEGVPKSALVTNAKIDFTVNSFYSNETQKVRRVMTAWVYKDQFGEWAIKNTYTFYPGK